MYCKIATVTRHSYYIRITLANTKRPVFFNLLPTFRPLIYIRAIDADNAAVIVRSIEKQFLFCNEKLDLLEDIFMEDGKYLSENEFRILILHHFLEYFWISKWKEKCKRFDGDTLIQKLYVKSDS